MEILAVESSKAVNVDMYVRKFINNLKQSIAKRYIPKGVKPDLDKHLYEKVKMDEKGWKN